MWSRLLALALLLLPAAALAGVKEKVAALAPSALVLVMDAEGDELVAQNADEPFVPASVAKIVTAWLAMEVLGGDYRFETRFYLDDKRVLYVRGGGDPFLISEELAELATELVAAVGKAPIAGIVLDASYYPPSLRIPGVEDTDEAYNALNSALAVNFNTVYAVRSGDTVRSAEKQTPITPLAIAQFRAQVPGGSGRISLSQDPAVSLQYAGELIAAFITRAGGSVNGEISTGTVPEGLAPVYIHRQSRALSEILVELLKDSNNYTANQVFLEIGGRRRRVDGADRRGLCDVHRQRRRKAPRRRGELEQRLVSALGLRRHQLHVQLGLCPVRCGRFVDRRLSVDHPARAGGRAAGGVKRDGGRDRTPVSAVHAVRSNSAVPNRDAPPFPPVTRPQP